MCAKQSSHTFLPKDRLQVPATDHACTSYVDTEKFVVPTFERTSSFLPPFQKVSPNKIYFPSNQNEVVIKLTTNEAPNPNPIPNIFFFPFPIHGFSCQNTTLHVSVRDFWSQIFQNLRHFRDQKKNIKINLIKWIIDCILNIKTVSVKQVDDTKWRKKTVFPQQRRWMSQFHHSTCSKRIHVYASPNPWSTHLTNHLGGATRNSHCITIIIDVEIIAGEKS